MKPGEHWHRPWWLRFLDKTSFTVTTLTACTILFTRSAGVLYFAVGALLCSVTVKAIKRAIRQPRPIVEHASPSQRKLTYGMPSTHSATILYFATYIPLACTKLPVHPSFPDSTLITRVLPPLVIIPWASLIAASRVWLGHHTWKQVIVGGSYGVAFAAVWFKVWTGGVDVYGEVLEQVVNEHIDEILGGVL